MPWYIWYLIIGVIVGTTVSLLTTGLHRQKKLDGEFQKMTAREVRPTIIAMGIVTGALWWITLVAIFIIWVIALAYPPYHRWKVERRLRNMSMEYDEKE